MMTMGAISTTAEARPAQRRLNSSRVTLPAERDLLRMCLFGTIVLYVSQANQQFGLLAKTRPALTLVGIALIAAFLNPSALAKNGWQRRWPAKVLLGITL